MSFWGSNFWHREKIPVYSVIFLIEMISLKLFIPSDDCDWGKDGLNQRTGIEFLAQFFLRAYGFTNVLKMQKRLIMQTSSDTQSSCKNQTSNVCNSDAGRWEKLYSSGGKSYLDLSMMKG